MAQESVAIQRLLLKKKLPNLNFRDSTLAFRKEEIRSALEKVLTFQVGGFVLRNFSMIKVKFSLLKNKKVIFAFKFSLV